MRCTKRKFVLYISVLIKLSPILRFLLPGLGNSRCYKKQNLGFITRKLLHIKYSGKPSAFRKFLGSRGGIVPFILKLFTTRRLVVSFRRKYRYSVNKVFVGH
jgi:hypothetical protein